MDILYLLLGVLLFVVTVLDLTKTVFTTNGGGRMANFVAKQVWKVFFAAAGRRGRSLFLEYAGGTALVATLMIWILGLWLGLLLVMLSDENSIRDASTKAPADWLEKLYFAGFTLSTLGIGDYVPTSNLWRVITGLAAFSGLAFITASITYFVPVLSAVNLQSRISLYVYSMGKTPQEVLINSWNGKDFSSFFSNASNLASLIMQHDLNHHSYPVIHYYHKSRESMSVKPAIVLLDETVQILTLAVAQKEAGIDALKLGMLRTTLDSYISTVKDTSFKNLPDKGKAPIPALDKLAGEGIPLNGEDTSCFTKEEVKHHRKMLTWLLESDGWSWQDVYDTAENYHVQ